MNFIKKIFSFIFNPFNSLAGEKPTTKATERFAKHPLMIFFVAVIITAMIFVFYYLLA